MSAVVCGKRSSFFQDHHNLPSSSSSSSSSASPPISKRVRCSSTSPATYSSTTSSTFTPIDRLLLLFPDMDKQLLERALYECGDDIETAIKSLTELRLGSVDNLKEINHQFQSRANGLANGLDGEEWVNLFVREMLSANNMDDARIRASRALELLEKSISERVTAHASSLQQENATMKEQLQVLIHENALLKRAVAIQHERKKEFEDRDQELHNLKQMVSQYQEQLRTLEVNNYSLTMHLKQAQQSNSIPGRFKPDVF